MIAVNYGSRDEITRAVKKVMEDVKAGRITEEEMTESRFASYLDTAGIPDPDLLIRTSGELRLSNYLLWQLAYSELYVTDCLWPDFNKEELLEAIRQYNKLSLIHILPDGRKKWKKISRFLPMWR